MAIHTLSDGTEVDVPDGMQAFELPDGTYVPIPEKPSEADLEKLGRGIARKFPDQIARADTAQEVNPLVRGILKEATAKDRARLGTPDFDFQQYKALKAREQRASGQKRKAGLAESVDLIGRAIASPENEIVQAIGPTAQDLGQSVVTGAANTARGGLSLLGGVVKGGLNFLSNPIKTTGAAGLALIKGGQKLASDLSQPSGAVAAARGAADTVGLGGAGVSAYVRAKFPNLSPRDHDAYVQYITDTQNAKFPAATAAGQIAGGLATGRAAGVLGKASTARTAATGAAVGGLTATSQGRDGVAEAVSGAAAPLAFSGAQRAARAGASLLGNVARAPGPRSTLTQLQAAGISPDDLASRTEALPNASIAEVLTNDEVARITPRVATGGQKSVDVLNKSLNEQSAAREARLQAVLRDDGKGDARRTVEQERDAIKGGQKASERIAGAQAETALRALRDNLKDDVASIPSRNTSPSAINERVTAINNQLGAARRAKPVVTLNQADLEALLKPAVISELARTQGLPVTLERRLLQDALDDAKRTGQPVKFDVAADDLEALRGDVQRTVGSTGSARLKVSGYRDIVDILDRELPGYKATLRRSSRLQRFGEGATKGAAALRNGGTGKADELDAFFDSAAESPTAKRGALLGGRRELRQRAQSATSLATLQKDLLNDDYFARVQRVVGPARAERLREIAQNIEDAPATAKANLQRIREQAEDALSEAETQLDAIKTGQSITSRGQSAKEFAASRQNQGRRARDTSSQAAREALGSESRAGGKASARLVNDIADSREFKTKLADAFGETEASNIIDKAVDEVGRQNALARLSASTRGELNKALDSVDITSRAIETASLLGVTSTFYKAKLAEQWLKLGVPRKVAVKLAEEITDPSRSPEIIRALRRRGLRTEQIAASFRASGLVTAVVADEGEDDDA